MGKLAILVVAGLFVAFWIGGSWLKPDDGPPPRPAGVPAEAVWARDGKQPGEWIACSPGTRYAVWACQIYDESGFQVHSGNYVMESAPGSAGAAPEIRYRDGDVIHGANGDLAPSGRHTDFSRDGRQTETNFPVRSAG